MAHSQMRLVDEVAGFLQRRDSSASTSFISSSHSSVISEGPGSLSPTATPVASSNSFPASSQALTAALSLLGLIFLGMQPPHYVIGVSCPSGIVFWRLRVWRRKSTQTAASVSDGGDLEQQKDKWLAPSTTVPISFDTVAAPPGVAWTPQIRSISGPEPVREGVKPPPPKRSRSPPPTIISKPPQDPFADPRPKSVPPRSPRTLDVESAIGLSAPSSPQPYALSVSGYQVRGLWTKEKGTRDSEV